jgi:2-keto-4-pentenoate hydratase
VTGVSGVPSVHDLAVRQLADYRAGTPGLWFAEHDGSELTLEEAYAVQDEVVALRSGDVVVGYKVGCTGPGTRAQFGLDGPIRGTLLGTELHTSGVALAASAFAGLAIEGELALRIGLDGEPDRVLPVVELHNYVFRGQPPTLQELVANNGLNAGVVLPAGAEEPWPGDDRLDGLLRVEVDGRVVDAGPMTGVPGGPSGSLDWLRGHLAQRGLALRPGHLVLTGTALGLIPVVPGNEVRVDADGLGEVGMSVLP